MQSKNVGMVEASEVAQVPCWWQVLPNEEKEVIRDALRAFQGLKRSRSPEVAKAAGKWERSIKCFIKCRLVGENRKAESRKRKSNPPGRMPDSLAGKMPAATAGPASLRSQPGVSPSRD